MIASKEYRLESIIENLNDLYRLSNYISYKRLGKDKDKLRKKLKKIIKKLENNELEGIIDTEFEEE